MADVRRLHPVDVVPVRRSPAPLASKAPKGPTVAQDRFERQGAVASAPIEQWRSAILALRHLPDVPQDVPGKREWVAVSRRLLGAAQQAQLAMQLAAFPDEPDLMVESEAAFTAIANVELRVRRVEEQAGLRRPEPPPDPKRPMFQQTQSLQALNDSPIGAALSAAIFPVVGLLDTADALSRRQQALDYPAAMSRYRARLAEYEKARTEHPLGVTQ